MSKVMSVHPIKNKHCPAWLLHLRACSGTDCILPFENDVWNHLFRVFRRRESYESVDKLASLFQNPEEANLNLDPTSCNSGRLSLGLQVFAALVGATVHWVFYEDQRGDEAFVSHFMTMTCCSLSL
jgi:hypothetical protein